MRLRIHDRDIYALRVSECISAPYDRFWLDNITLRHTQYYFIRKKNRSFFLCVCWNRKNIISFTESIVGLISFCIQTYLFRLETANEISTKLT